MDVHLRILAASQRELAARWQLIAAGYSERQIDDRAWRHRWRHAGDGVYALNHAPLTREQRWLAACLSAPGTLLCGPSAAACWGISDHDPAVISVLRRGSGGPRHLDGLRVCRAALPGDDVAWCDGIPVTSAERTLIDLSPHLGERRRGRLVREAIRLRLITAESLLDALDRHRGRRGTLALRELARRYRR